MAAATRSASTATALNFPYNVTGLTPFELVIPVATTDIDDIGDEIRCAPAFPTNARIWYLTATSADLDSDSALRMSVIADDGSTEVTICAAGTLGSAATTVAIDAANIGAAVGGKQLTLKTTTAATSGDAGNITLRGLFSVDVVSLTATAV
jgi:hypothetical protein